MPAKKHSLESCKRVAQKYKTVKEFRTHDHPSYKACVRHGWKEEVCAHMTKGWRELTDDEAIEMTKKYRTIAEMQKDDPSLYQIIRRRKLLETIREFMEPGKPSYTKEEIHEEAKKHKTRGEFDRANSKFYSYAYKHGWLNEVCSHMGPPKNMNRTKESVAQDALEYNRRIDFQKENPASYKWAHKNGLVEEICQHMDVFRREWNEESVAEVAKKYTNRKDFKEKDSAAWAWVRKRPGLVTKICEHMPDPPLCNRFSRSGWEEYYPEGSYLYLISFDNYCKCGITGRSLKERFKDFPFSPIVLKCFFSSDSGLIFDLEKKFLSVANQLLEPYNEENDWSGSKEAFITTPEIFLDIFNEFISGEGYLVDITKEYL